MIQEIKIARGTQAVKLIHVILPTELVAIDGVGFIIGVTIFYKTEV